MSTYKATFTMIIGGEISERSGGLFNVKFGEATEGFSMGLNDGDVVITATELSA